jgi:hypothetical protein
MTTLRNATVEVSQAAYDSLTGKGDPQQRFRIYRLCECEACEGDGHDHSPLDPKADRAKALKARCPECRGEGKVRQLVATAETPAGLGEALVQNGREGAFAECPVGVLDTEGEVGQKWLVNPWLPSARNISDAGRTLAQARHTKGERSE